MTLPMAKADLCPTATPRDVPYIWVSHLSKLLAGDQECEYASWLKANYRFRKRDADNFDLAGWKNEHDAVVERRAQELFADGWTVTYENANAWKLTGKTAIVAGKCDLVAKKPGQILVVDGKTGAQRNSDYHQVLIYLAVWPLAFSVDPTSVRGEVVYPTTTIPIQNAELTEERKAALWALVRRLGDRQPPMAKPSPAECAFCDCPREVCVHRIDRPVQSAMTELF
jgi:CRISPR/Cas system-associated exonuclease Cas4 (RecB family)